MDALSTSYRYINFATRGLFCKIFGMLYKVKIDRL